MFKDHHNFRRIKFIVDPDMREILDTNPQNIPKPWNEIKEKYSKLLPIIDVQKMDVLCNGEDGEDLDPNLWFL